MKRFILMSIILVAFLSMGCATTKTVTRTYRDGVTTVDSTTTKTVMVPTTRVDVSYNRGWYGVGHSFRRQMVRSYNQATGPKLIWHTFAGGVQTSPGTVTFDSRHDRTRFTIVANCHPSRIVIYRDGVEFRHVTGRNWSFDLPNDFDNSVRTYVAEVTCEGDELPWSWEFDVESSPPRMRGSYP